MIRPATLKDKPVIQQMVLKETSRYPLRPDIHKIQDALQEVIEAGRHYAMVAERDGQVEGALLAITNENLWAQRKTCTVVFWMSRSPGDGAALLRRFRQWIKGRRTAIRVAGFSPDIEVDDPRVWELAQRIGFKRYGGSYLYYN